VKTNAFRRLAGKVVLVTGAWGGLGKHFVRQLLASNAKVILSDLREQPLAQLEEGGGLPAGWQSHVLGQVVVDLNSPRWRAGTV
jgi:NAD(P)-dependent dehydrogenase (short-subunit alcohol dehydrogenase family)